MAMNLKQRLNEQLGELALRNSGCKESQPLCLETEHGRLTLHLRQVDRLACALNRVTLSSCKLSRADCGVLQGIAEDLAQRLVYLLEAIDTLEIDREAGFVQMRSRPPTNDDCGISYYELLIRPSGIDLRRYNKPPGQPRRVVAATVTREVLHRLVEDIVAAGARGKHTAVGAAR
jgi:hypothetical protein